MEYKNAIRHLTAVTGAIYILIPLLCTDAIATGGDAGSLKPTVEEHVKVSPNNDTEPESHLWRTSLWEAIPAELLRTGGPSPLLEAYQLRGWKPFFINCRFELTPVALTFLDRLRRLDREAINPAPYKIEMVTKVIKNLEQRRLALKDIDPELKDTSSALFEYSSKDAFCELKDDNKPKTASDHANPSVSTDAERLRYREIFNTASEADILLMTQFIRFSREMNPYAKDRQNKVFQGEIPISEFLEELNPPSDEYFPLIEALGKYRHLASQGGQQVVHLGSGSLKAGDSGEVVRNLQKRLQQEGFYAGKLTGSFDALTQEAVKRFQAAHALEIDGKVGRGTVDSLNISYTDKVRMVEHSLQLVRQSATRQHDRFLRINIPQFKLEYHKQGEVKAVHPVIVGKSAGKKVKVQGRLIGENHTPPISSAIQQVIINPRWYVTDRIRGEMEAEAGSDPTYFSRNGYVQMSSYYPSGRPRIYMLPGPKNPLGLVKFEFPNAHAIFLHDTPKRNLFQRQRRDFSHGCIRVDRAMELAELILSEDGNPSASKVQTHIDSTRQTYIKLSTPLPIVIEYLPVAADSKGNTIFFGDLYGWLEDSTNKGKS